jgi:CBS domain-containing protein
MQLEHLFDAEITSRDPHTSSEVWVRLDPGERACWEPPSAVVLEACVSSQQASVEEAMSAGPSTIRPSARLDAIRARMHDQNLTRMIVTRSDGTLVGVLRGEDIRA